MLAVLSRVNVWPFVCWSVMGLLFSSPMIGCGIYLLVSPACIVAIGFMIQRHQSESRKSWLFIWCVYLLGLVLTAFVLQVLSLRYVDDEDDGFEFYFYYPVAWSISSAFFVPAACHLGYLAHIRNWSWGILYGYILLAAVYSCEVNWYVFAIVPSILLAVSWVVSIVVMRSKNYPPSHVFRNSLEVFLVFGLLGPVSLFPYVPFVCIGFIWFSALGFDYYKEVKFFEGLNLSKRELFQVFGLGTLSPNRIFTSSTRKYL